MTNVRTSLAIEGAKESSWRGTRGAGKRSDTGQSLVELALMFPIFILLLVGAAEFGRLAYAAIEVSNAARAGASYGSLSHITASDFTNIELVATTDAANLTGVTATATNFCACSTGGTITCSTALTSCPSPARIIEYVQVNTSASFDPLFHLPGIPTTFPLSGQAIMRVEQ
ncbi:MAG TPA: TadE/TadG family type IV pilus assembly protein [Acidobacteriaceae bacterium]|nr:TadE/TadG family type IV pilus assembly protein [Acidobacteriaceae bacterium]